MSITQPSSSGSCIASAEDEVCRPRPVTSLTTPMARSVPGTRAFSSVDLPTPEWPISTLIRPESRSRSSSSPTMPSASVETASSGDSRRVTTCSRSSGAVRGQEPLRGAQIGLGEHQQRLDPGDIGRDQAAIDHAAAGLGVLDSGDHHHQVDVRDQGSFRRVVVVGAAPQEGAALLDPHDPCEGALAPGDVTDETYKVTGDDRGATQLPGTHRGNRSRVSGAFADDGPPPPAVHGDHAGGDGVLMLGPILRTRA